MSNCPAIFVTEKFADECTNKEGPQKLHISGYLDEKVNLLML
jgi:hypothetical protein